MLDDCGIISSYLGTSLSLQVMHVCIESGLAIRQRAQDRAIEAPLRYRVVQAQIPTNNVTCVAADGMNAPSAASFARMPGGRDSDDFLATDHQVRG